MCRSRSPTPGPLCISNQPRTLDAQTRKLAAIAYGEASTANDADEIGGIAFAVANRARRWDHKTVDQLLAADPNYTYAVKDGNARTERLMRANESEIEADLGMSVAVKAAAQALAGIGPDPSGGGYWWDGVDFKTNYENHPKVADGFRFGNPSHNIFGVKESSRAMTTHWIVKNKEGASVEGKPRGSYSHVWVSTAAHGRTIFWTHDPDYLHAAGAKDYR
jgi:hypothetical protein